MIGNQELNSSRIDEAIERYRGGLSLLDDAERARTGEGRVADR